MVVKSHHQHCWLSKAADFCGQTKSALLTVNCSSVLLWRQGKYAMVSLVAACLCCRGAIPDSSAPCSHTQHSMLHQVLDWALGLPASQRSLYPSAADDKQTSEHQHHAVDHAIFLTSAWLASVQLAVTHRWVLDLSKGSDSHTRQSCTTRWLSCVNTATAVKSVEA